jgi:hypothetical protein
VVVAADEGLQVEDLAEPAAAHGRLDGQVVGVPPAVLVDGQGQPGVRRGRDLPVRLLDRDAERLLDHHRLAGLQRPQHPVGVRVRRGRDDDQVDLVVGEQRVTGGVPVGLRCVRPGSVDPGRDRVADGGEREPLGGRDACACSWPMAP